MVKEIRRYPEKFKRELIERIETGRIGVEAARRKYGIGGNMTISYWRKKYGKLPYKIVRTFTMNPKIEAQEQAARIETLERELLLYKKLIEVSDYFRDPQVKKKIVERLSNYLGKQPEELQESDLPFLKSVMYSESVGRDIIRNEPEGAKEKNKKPKSLGK